MTKAFRQLLTQEFKSAFAAKMLTPELVKFVVDAKADATDSTGKFRMIISTPEMDRQGEIVSQEGYVLENYLKNPVVLLNHDYYNGLPVGVTDSIVRDSDGNTIAEGRFAPTEEAQELRKYYDAGFPIAASVGFIPIDGENGTITKAELLEWSFVKVPANAGCVPADEARARGVNIALLTAKGFEFTTIKTTPPIERKDGEKSSEVGDECEMDDGGVGIFTDEGDGTLVCRPIEEDSAKAIRAIRASNLDDGVKLAMVKNIFVWSALNKKAADDEAKEPEDTLWEDHKAEHAFHEKAVKGHLKEFVEACKAESPQGTEEEDKAFHARMKAAIADHEKKLKTVLKAEHERHMKAIELCWKSFKASKPGGDEDSDDQSGQEGQNDHDADNEKAVAAIVKAITGEKLTEKEVLEIAMKAGHLVSNQAHEKLTALCESFADAHAGHADAHEKCQKAIDEFKSFLEKAEPSEGNDGAKAHPEKRSIPSADLDAKTIEDLARLLNDATREALTKINLEKSGKRSR